MTSSPAPGYNPPNCFAARVLAPLIRPLLALLVIIDIVLGGVAVFFPWIYMDFIHPDAPPDEPVYLLIRAGVIWLGYLVIQAIAFFQYRRVPEWILVVAFLRLVEVPADTVYVVIGCGIGLLGRIGLIVAPVFNLIVGIIFVWWYFRCGRFYLGQVL